MADDRNRLGGMAKALEVECAHVSVREDEGTPYLFAVGKRHIHSLELRRKDGSLVIEYWRGPPNADEFVSAEVAPTFEDAFSRCKQWLANDAT
jgi:hypothetical protein